MYVCNIVHTVLTWILYMTWTVMRAEEGDRTFNIMSCLGQLIDQTKPVSFIMLPPSSWLLYNKRLRSAIEGTRSTGLQHSTLSKGLQ